MPQANNLFSPTANQGQPFTPLYGYQGDLTHGNIGGFKAGAVEIHNRIFGGAQQASQSQSYVDPLQQQYLGGLYQAGANTYNQYGSLAGRLTQGGMGMINQLGQQQSPQYGPGLQLGVLQQQLGQQASLGMNEIQNRFGMSGSIGSRAGVAGGQLMEGLGRNLALGASSIFNNANNQNLAYGQLNQQGLLGGLGQLGMVSQLPYSGLGALSSLFGSPTVLNQEQEQQRQTKGLFDGGIGGMLGAAGFSDRRLKRDIEPLGAAGGHRWYKFRYLWSDAPQVGVMAQEVMQTCPDAVSVHPSGYLMVDYGRLN